MAKQSSTQKISNILDPVHVGLPVSVWDDPESDQPILKSHHAKWIKRKIYAILTKGGYTDVESWLSLYLTGSLTTYQYSDNSDCDVSLFVNTKIFPEWSRAEMIGLMIDQMDGTTLPGTPYPMQDFVVAKDLLPEDLYKVGVRSAYNIDTNTWFVPPDRNRIHDPKSEENGFYIFALQQADKMERLLRYEPDKAVMFWHQLHAKRMRDMKAGKGDYSESNIILKFLAQRKLLPEISEASGEYIAKVGADMRELSERLDAIPGAKRIAPIPNHEVEFAPGDRVTREYSMPVQRSELGLPGEGYADLNSGTVLRAHPDHRYDIQWDIGASPNFDSYYEPGQIAEHTEGERFWPEGHENLYKSLIDPKAPESVPDWMVEADLRKNATSQWTGDHEWPSRTSNVIDTTFNALQHGEGITVNLDGVQPAIGYAFSPNKTTETTIPLKEISPEIISQFINAHLTELKHPENFLGVWINGNVAVFDVSIVVPDEQEALARAAENKQKSIWDMANSREIVVPEQTFAKTAMITPEQQLEWLASHPYVYHEAHPHHIDKIMKEGIRPVEENSGKGGAAPGHVYLHTQQNPNAIFRVDLSKLDPSKINFDADWSGWDYGNPWQRQEFVNYPDSPFNDPEKVQHSYDRGSIAYEGDIPPEAVEYNPDYGRS